MTVQKLLLAGVTALVTLGACPALADRTCLQEDQINNWKALDDRTLIVEDYWHKKYELKLIGICNNLQFHERLAFRVIGGSGISCLTPGDEIIARERGFGPERCAITSIREYTPDMERADRAAAEATGERRHGN